MFIFKILNKNTSVLQKKSRTSVLEEYKKPESVNSLLIHVFFKHSQKRIYNKKRSLSRRNIFPLLEMFV